MNTVVMIWYCAQCHEGFDSREEAECCEFNHDADRRGEGPLRPCQWCDCPSTYNYDDGWIIDCDHHIYGMHENAQGDAENDAYETIQRFRGVEMLPWEYPHLKEVL